MATLNFKPKSVTNKMVSCLKERTRDIIVQRFGLGDEEKKTLEAIGDNYGITRERVRQITNFAVNTIKENQAFESHKGVFEELKDIIEKRGKILSEREILGSLADDPFMENHLYFLLVLGDEFTKMKEDDEFHHRWTVDEGIAGNVHEALRNLHKEINENDLIPEKKIISSLVKHSESLINDKISEEIARSWLNISKIVAANPLGDWGHSMSPSIKPRGVRDLAFLVLRKEGSPMHFIEVARKIASYFDRGANPATVHNELIKDGRFVLVGRGLYALNDWGYKYGTVRDVIKFIIKSEGPANKEEIIKKVLKERYVKENTILVNLQNRNYFKRNREGKYLIS